MMKYAADGKGNIEDLRSLCISFDEFVEEDLTCCMVCEKQVRGVLVVCPKCEHGGHLKHVKGWFLNHETCPLCDCRCELGL